jgi:hypothetical protein
MSVLYSFYVQGSKATTVTNQALGSISFCAAETRFAGMVSDQLGIEENP